MKEQDLRDKFGNLDTVIISDCGDRQMCIPNGKMTENTTDKCVQIAKDYAEKEAIEFSEWLQQNRWFSFQNGYWYYTFENAIAISNEAYNKKYRKTTSELYQLFKNRENER